MPKQMQISKAKHAILMNKLVKRFGGKKEAGEALGLSLRTVYYVLNGRKPSKKIQKLIELAAKFYC